MKYDTIIIGSGAGGGTVAYELAKAGKNILILERGGFVPQEDENWDAKAVFCDNRYVSRDTWVINGQPTQPQAHYNVGGATKFYGAALFRLRPSDFQTWPIRYADLEPWYSAAEQLYQVHGRHGEDPTEGPWSQQYPHGPVPHARVIGQLSDDLTAAGYHPFHAPSAVLLQQGGPCIRCNACDGFPCKVAGKADAETIAVRPILDMPNVTLITGAEVIRITVSGSDGHATGVYAVVNGKMRWYQAEQFVLAAGAVNTAAILLASGIANSSDQVGRNYMYHDSRAVIAVGREPNDTVFQKTLAIHDKLPFGTIQMVGKSSGQAMRGEDKLARLCPDWPLEKTAAHAVDFWLTTEDDPKPFNRVTLNSYGGIQLNYTRTSRRKSEVLYDQLKGMLRRAGHHYLYADMEVGPAAVAHQAGTARMGLSRYQSVVDINGKCHDLSNLYVADSSVFPSIGAVNPALTVMALALRLGNHLGAM